MFRNIFDQIASELQVEKVLPSQMFGKPCLKIGKKAFAVFYQDEMVFKVGREEVELLLEKYVGSQRFDPSGKGRAMKDWVQIPSEYFSDWQALAKDALEYVESLK
ncbi:MAG: hypothetical protein AAGC47_09435 [Bacteroidota bacterium]